MSRPPSKYKSDPFVKAGTLTPTLIAELQTGSGAIVANTTGYDQFAIPVAWETVYSGSTNHGAARATEAQIYISNLGVGGASGTNTFTLNKVDGFGNILTTLATFNPAYNVKYQLVNLTDFSGAGYILSSADILRLDSGALAGGLSTNPSGIIVRLFGGAASVKG